MSIGKAWRQPFALMALAICAGALTGLFLPALALRLEWLGTAFVVVIRLLVGPIQFVAVVGALAKIGPLRRAGALGVKALLYFELVSMLALLTGMAVALWLRPGEGLQLAVSAAPAVQGWQATLGAALLHNPLLQVLAAAVVTGAMLSLLGPRADAAVALCERCAEGLDAVLRLLLLAAPLAAFGAIAFAVASFGAAAMLPLVKLIGVLYLASFVFVFVAVVLGGVCAASGMRLGRLIAGIKEELLLVVATASSTAAMPRLIDKLTDAGCPRAVAGLLVPLGFSFNLNGSAVYLGASLMFLAQACGIALTAAQLLPVLVVAMLTSKAASGVAGSAFVTLAATLVAVPGIPASALVYIVGIERLLKCRPVSNLIGNTVACLAICAWSGRLDRRALKAAGLAV